VRGVCVVEQGRRKERCQMHRGEDQQQQRPGSQRR